jgi:hypothetical protein
LSVALGYGVLKFLPLKQVFQHCALVSRSWLKDCDRLLLCSRNPRPLCCSCSGFYYNEHLLGNNAPAGQQQREKALAERWLAVRKERARAVAQRMKSITWNALCGASLPQ